MNRIMSAKLLEQEEGRVPYAYKDDLGFLTIGVGHLIDKERGGRLSDRIIDAILDEDINEKWSQVVAHLPWVTTLSDARQFVFLSMAFQLGIAGLLNFKKFIAAARVEDWGSAVVEMKDSKWARDDSPERADRLARQLFRDEWVFKHPEGMQA